MNNNAVGKEFMTWIVLGFAYLGLNTAIPALGLTLESSINQRNTKSTAIAAFLIFCSQNLKYSTNFLFSITNLSISISMPINLNVTSQCEHSGQGFERTANYSRNGLQMPWDYQIGDYQICVTFDDFDGPGDKFLCLSRFSDCVSKNEKRSSNSHKTKLLHMILVCLGHPFLSTLIYLNLINSNYQFHIHLWDPFTIIWFFEKN